MVRTYAKPGLLAFAAIAAAAAVLTLPDLRPVTLHITMSDYKFVPDHLILERGVRYRLQLENDGKQTHEFTAPTFFAAAEVGNPEVLNRERSEVVVHPGETRDVIVTATRPGSYDLRCSDHDWAGMIGGISVN